MTQPSNRSPELIQLMNDGAGLRRPDSKACAFKAAHKTCFVLFFPSRLLFCSKMVALVGWGRGAWWGVSGSLVPFPVQFELQTARRDAITALWEAL